MKAKRQRALQESLQEVAMSPRVPSRTLRASCSCAAANSSAEMIAGTGIDTHADGRKILLRAVRMARCDRLGPRNARKPVRANSYLEIEMPKLWLCEIGSSNHVPSTTTATSDPLFEIWAQYGWPSASGC